MGKSVIKCVDVNGKTIKSLKVWKKANPGGLFFESKFEWEAWKLLKASGLDFTHHPPSREVMPPIKRLSLSKGATKKLFMASIRPIKYTSDFLINCDDGTKVYLETKGFFHSDARIRYKLFQATLKGKEITLLAYDTYGKGPRRMTDVKAIISLIKEHYNKKETINTIDI
tara:strand:- start:9 stop:518 length:510 start_codon:yes stop_codon:yes gene_type:complete